MNSTQTLLLVHLGDELPPWLAATLAQARLFTAGPILLLANATAISHAKLPVSLDVDVRPVEAIEATDKHELFRELSPLDRSFRNGFWTYTTERFFIIESAMLALGLQNVVHIENDVLVYCDLDQLVPKLRRLYTGIAATFDNDQRCVPGFMFIPGAASIAGLTSHILSALQVAMREQPRVQTNDMMLLGAYRRLGPQAIDHLPIVPPDYPAQLCSLTGLLPADATAYARHFSELGMAFDAAALGQFLGGIDPRNHAKAGSGFVNESCVFDPRCLKPRMVRNAQDLQVPVIETAGGVHPVANLHIHSKNPAPFLSRDGLL